MANSRVRARTAPLDAVYAIWGVALPIRATIDAVLITDALVFPCLRNDSTACLQPYQTPLTYVTLYVRLGGRGVRDRQGAYIDVEGFIPRGFGGRDRIAVLDEKLDGFHFHSHESKM